MERVYALSSPGLLLASHGHGRFGMDSDWMWLWGSLMMLALVALVGFAVWAIVRSIGGRERERKAGTVEPTTRAKEVLAERYARGEISRDEYREKLSDLQ